MLRESWHQLISVEELDRWMDEKDHTMYTLGYEKGLPECTIVKGLRNGLQKALWTISY